jgi:ELL-associated factor
VTIPHLDGSGVPNTVFKGPQRDYSKKDCLLIINRETKQFTLERLKSNLVMKKTRNESHSKPLPVAKQAVPSLENSTARQSSKTKVSTGNRKNTPISFVPRQSPIQSSPSYPHKSPSSAPQWNANNPLQTLPSFGIIGDDFEPINTKPSANTLPTSLIQPIASASNPVKMVENGIGEMTTSESSSDSNSSDSGSDSDSDDAAPPPAKRKSPSPSPADLKPNRFVANFSNGAALLNEDLRLSDSNSSDSDD